MKTKANIVKLLALTALTVAVCTSHGGEIHEAATRGDVEKIRKLARSNPALVNGKSQGGLTPLHLASTAEAAAVLLENGADVGARDNDGFTPLHVVASGIDIISHRIKGNQQQTEAAKKTACEIVKILLAHKADINDNKNEQGDTPLHNAAIYGARDTVGLLLENKASVNIQEATGKTPLMFAAMGGRKNAVEALLARGADVNQKDERGTTALSHALELNWDDVVNLLRKHGAKE